MSIIYRYTTDYSIEDCMGILGRKNIYDAFEYSYEKKADNVIEIIIKECNTHLCNNQTKTNGEKQGIHR